MAKRSRPAQGDNTSLKNRRKMPATPAFTSYGQGATPHGKPNSTGATMQGSAAPKVTRSKPRRGNTGGAVRVVDLNT
jgi:hypothetical protein